MNLCGNEDCRCSTGIHGGLTFGSGDIDFNGFFEFACSPCARANEKKHPEDGECWPFKDQNVEQLNKLFQEDKKNNPELYFY